MQKLTLRLLAYLHYRSLKGNSEFPFFPVETWRLLWIRFLFWTLFQNTVSLGSSDGTKPGRQYATGVERKPGACGRWGRHTTGVRTPSQPPRYEATFPHFLKLSLRWKHWHNTCRERDPVSTSLNCVFLEGDLFFLKTNLMPAKLFLPVKTKSWNC